MLAREAAPSEDEPPETPRPRRFRFTLAKDPEPQFDDGDDAEEDRQDRRTLRTLIDRLSLSRVLWAMGLIFAAVGFVAGLFASPSVALVWVVFGLVLVLAAPHAPVVRPPDTEEQEMRD